MKQMPTPSVAARLNAAVAAAIVTLTMLSGIDTLAVVQSAAPAMAQASATQPA